MNMQSTSEPEFEKIEAEYLRLKPLREMEAMVHGLAKPDWKSALPPVFVTISCAFLAVGVGSDNLLPFFAAVAAALTWQFHLSLAESKRFNLVVSTLRTLAEQLREVRKEHA